MQSSRNTRATWVWVAHSASTKRVFWKPISSWPNAVRSLVYWAVSSTTRSMATTAPIAMLRRSCGSCCMSWTKPSPSASPSRFVAGTRTSSKNSSAVSWPFMPIFSSTRPCE